MVGFGQAGGLACIACLSGSAHTSDNLGYAFVEKTQQCVSASHLSLTINYGYPLSHYLILQHLPGFGNWQFFVSLIVSGAFCIHSFSSLSTPLQLALVIGFRWKHGSTLSFYRIFRASHWSWCISLKQHFQLLFHLSIIFLLSLLAGGSCMNVNKLLGKTILWLCKFCITKEVVTSNAYTHARFFFTAILH